MTLTRDINMEAKAWAKKYDLKGAFVLNRYVMFLFLENIVKTSEEFVFKGGNLLWHYIKTPRQTIDLDFVTLKEKSHDVVLSCIEKACHSEEDIEFKIAKFSELGNDDKVGGRFTIEFKSKNYKGRFGVDVMYALATDIKRIKSPIDGELDVNAASIEEI